MVLYITFSIGQVLLSTLSWCSSSAIPIFFKNFPQIDVTHIVKGFSIVNEAAVDAFLEFPCFFYDPTDAGDLISGSFAFSKSRLNTSEFLVHILLKLSLQNFKHHFASM